MRKLLRGLRAVIRQISDENAYDRYLRRTGRVHSREEWRRFSDDHFARKYARAKCC